MLAGPTPGSPHGWPWFTGLAVLAAAGLWLALGPAPPALVYDRAAIAQGEWWRLFTGHLVHSGGSHALWDIAALAVIGTVLEGRGRLRMALAAVAGMLAVGLAIWTWLPGLGYYCGLSGMLNTLFVVALAGLWQRRRHPAIAAVALALLAKMVAETLVGHSVVVQGAWPSVPFAHWAGALCGLSFAALDRWAARTGQAPPPPAASRIASGGRRSRFAPESTTKAR